MSNLYNACLSGDLELVKASIKRGDFIEDGCFLSACYNGYDEIVAILIDYVKTFHAGRLSYIAQLLSNGLRSAWYSNNYSKGHVKIIKMLIDQGVKPFSQDEFNPTNKRIIEILDLYGNNLTEQVLDFFGQTAKDIINARKEKCNLVREMPISPDVVENILIRMIGY
jgi:hypothetical protein